MVVFPLALLAVGLKLLHQNLGSPVVPFSLFAWFRV